MNKKQLVGIIGAVLVLVISMFLPAMGEISQVGMRTIGMLAAFLILLVTEALPVVVISLIFCAIMPFPDRILIQVGTAENCMVDTDDISLHQQSHKGTTQGAAIGGADAATQIFLYVGFDLLGFRQHVGEDGGLCFVKAVIGYADHMKMRLQKRYDLPEIQLPVAAGAGEQQNRGIILCTKGIEFHMTFLLIELQMQDQHLLFLFCNHHGYSGYKTQFLTQHF